MKRFFSILLSTLLIINSITVLGINTTAYAASSYADTLRSKGFPESYIEPLVELHEKYKNWIFEPLQTNLDWQTAVNGERSSHSKQLIEKCSLYNSNMYCKCSSCYKNGNYVIREGNNWVAASEIAVKYYMDPRNWLDEKSIFQFESTSYDGTQTKAGVESILDGTWMHDSLISYKTTAGTTKTYNSTTKYSDAIIKAANDSGMSSYYLASKIRQENGSSTASATAVKGTASPFQGIYNYYNIGAYSGAYDGLAFAAGYLKANKKTTLYSSYNSTTGKAGGTMTTIANGQYMTWRNTEGNYYKVRLYAENGSNSYTEGKSGYILKSDVRTTYTRFDTSSTAGWGRPWSNPYLTIYYGAKYIAKNFSAQDSGYLQKYNVSPKSQYLYSNEYMANVAAAVSEAQTTYNAYLKANILPITKKFVIPVFKNMPNEPTALAQVQKVSNVKATNRTDKAVKLTWNSVSNATGYQVQVYRASGWKTEATVTTTSASMKNLASGCAYTFRVRAYTTVAGKTYYGEYSDMIFDVTYSSKLSNIKTSSTNNTVTISWSKKTNGTGYRVTMYDESKKKYVLYKQIEGLNNTSITVKGLKSNKSYKFKVYAYKEHKGVMRGGYNDEITVKTKNNMVTLKSAESPSTKKISVKWTKLSTSITGYEIMWSTSSKFSSNFLSKYKTSDASSITLTTSRSKTYYYVRVRAYKKSGSKTTYYSWSKTKKVYVK